MRLDVSHITGTVLGTACSLLFLTSFIQGLLGIDVLHHQTMEAVAGQSIDLPCIVQNYTSLNIVQVEWSKMNNTKLAVYNLIHGGYVFHPNVTIWAQRAGTDEQSTLIGTNLRLQVVGKQDSGVYICDISTFPLGSISTSTQLKVKDVSQIKCNMNSSFEVHRGENVSIRCTVDTSSGAQYYNWTKDEKLLSVNEFLQLSWVTDAHAGVYRLTVDTGNNQLQAAFNITVLTATSNMERDLNTSSGPPRVTDSHTISPSTKSPHPAISGAWTTKMDPNVTADELTATTSDGNHNTSLNVSSSFLSDRVNMAVTDPSTMPLNPDHLHNSTDVAVTTTSIPSPSVSYDPSTVQLQSSSSDMSMPTTVGYGGPVERTGDETESKGTEKSSFTLTAESSTLKTTATKPEKPTASTTLTDEDSIGDMIEKDTGRSLWWIIVPILVLIVLAGILYRIRIIQKRMDMPPPFKPPPPPEKYTLVYTQRSPVNRKQPHCQWQEI
ncbi:T-cell surface protein tactile isoform X2 [Lampris incognitus]|uniref:T-cell surface protein tactile isoform X2 n=1 Tax=Lampris incognitus TaxID=2546036 RepID=UPI0024B541DE|nr:T-cell surface protein tactile isoform X2 [Lampris incognitus]